MPPPLRSRGLPGRNAMRSFCDRIVALVFVVGLLLPARQLPMLGHTKTHSSASRPNFGDTADAIDALAVSGDPRTGPLLEALKDQRLLYSTEPGGSSSRIRLTNWPTPPPVNLWLRHHPISITFG